MKAVSCKNLDKESLEIRIGEVCQDNEPLVITRDNNQSVVMLSMDEYNSYIETQYLLSSEENAKRLARSIRDAENSKVIAHELIK